MLVNEWVMVLKCCSEVKTGALIKLFLVSKYPGLILILPSSSTDY